MHTDTAAALAESHGLMFRGGFSVSPEDAVPDQPSGRASRTLLLFGQAGSGIWPQFIASAEYADGNPNPLDRWSQRIATRMASELEGVALFPFGGPPYHPIIRWAARAEGLRASRLGMLLHPQYGLWHAYRFAIALPIAVEGVHGPTPGPHACDSCHDRPCLRACPVGAFDGGCYNVRACFNYLEAHPHSACLASGCTARAACPEGREYYYDKAHARFHMLQFHRALGARSRGEHPVSRRAPHPSPDK